jgi:hypothetical protein
MSEDQQNTTDQQSSQAPSILGEGMAFSEGWREHLPEDIRAEPSLANVRDLPGLAKSYVNAQRMIGRDKIVLPKDDSPAS